VINKETNENYIEELIKKVENQGLYDLTDSEIKILKEYYKSKNSEMKKEIQYKEATLKRLNKKLNKYYEEAIRLKIQEA